MTRRPVNGRVSPGAARSLARPARPTDRSPTPISAELRRLECWSVRTLRAKIGGMLFERTATSKRSDVFIRRALDELRGSDRHIRAQLPSLRARRP